MGRALSLARRGLGATSPNPMVGAVLVRGNRIVGEGFHKRAGEPHAEINAMRDAARRGHPTRGATLYVTLEPCSTHGRTPPCTDAIVAAGIRRVVVGSVDPNPQHAGRGLKLLRRAAITVSTGVLSEESKQLNEAFNHWIVHRTPLATVKAAMTLDGKIATAKGESKWITGPVARTEGMKLRRASDAILVGVNTIIADDPALTLRTAARRQAPGRKALCRVILDSHARIPLTARVLTDQYAALTTVVVTRSAPARRIAALRKCVNVLIAPEQRGRVNLRWLLRRLGRENIASLLVEGGGEVNASFLEQRLVQRVAFFYAPKILGGRNDRRAVAGKGFGSLATALKLDGILWRRVGEDLMLTARIMP